MATGGEDLVVDSAESSDSHSDDESFGDKSEEETREILEEIVSTEKKVNYSMLWSRRSWKINAIEWFSG
jgi:hypothetical protein